MKRKSVWTVSPVVVAFGGLSLLLLLTLLFLNRTVFFVAAGVSAVVWAYGIWRLLSVKRDIRRYLVGIASQLNQTDRAALNATPMPVAVVSDNNQLIWYNDLFRKEVLQRVEALGESLDRVFPDISVGRLAGRVLPRVDCNGKTYGIYVSKLRVQDEVSYVLYCFDNTELTRIATEYDLSRPVVLSLYLDNSDEVTKHLRDSERAQLFSQVDMLLEDWANAFGGIFRKNGSDRFVILLEQRNLDAIEKDRFEILDKVRAIRTADDVSLTLSIGVGRGKTLLEADSQARQTLDMALGRGGDQAVVKTKNGFDFYGGLSKSVEKRTKVRSRVIASALQQLIAESDVVLTMGHRYSDLDCLGSAAALAAACRSMGKIAYAVYDPATTLASALVEHYRAQGGGDLFMECSEALLQVTPKTLLIITDIHQAARLELPELYQKVDNVAVIDHHRKMVDHIDDTVLFYHEPYSSSASEMVAEILQYMNGVKVSRTDAEALLAGIMLDTRNFVMKSGVRTFEAAAYLRKLGADTVNVKRMFSEDISIYQRKAEIITSAEPYRRMAIACADGCGTGMRIAASQAADELLCVKDVEASFVMFCENGGVNISARSYGEVNVQLIMEAVGGGGHQTMAGAYLKETDADAATDLLRRAIDTYLTERDRARAAQK